MFDRAILHLDLDAFFVSVELLRQPELRGKPIIIGGHSDRGVVSSCSYEARAFGVRSAMPTQNALRLCPEAIVIRGDMEAYAKQSRIVTQIIAEDAPLFQKASIDEFYVDLTGMDRYFGCWAWSQKLRQRIMRETGLPISAALSVNKTVSKIGTGEAKPNGELLIEAGTERAFLAPLPVGVMPFIGKETERKLEIRGIKTLGQLAETPVDLLERLFGKHGHSIWERAQGICNAPVSNDREAKSMSSERTFGSDTTDVRFLTDKLTELTTLLAYDLRQDEKICANVAIKVRYDDFTTHTHQRKIEPTSNDSVLLRHVHELFTQQYQKGRPVRLLGVRFSDLLEGNQQTSLFDNTVKESDLLKKLDHIRKRYGTRAVVRASTLKNQSKKQGK